MPHMMRMPSHFTTGTRVTCDPAATRAEVVILRFERVSGVKSNEHKNTGEILIRLLELEIVIIQGGVRISALIIASAYPRRSGECDRREGRVLNMN
jgi:hypothetical protein